MEAHGHSSKEMIHGTVMIRGSVVQIFPHITREEEEHLRRLEGNPSINNSFDNASNETVQLNRTKVIILDADRARKYLVVPPRVNYSSSAASDGTTKTNGNGAG